MPENRKTGLPLTADDLGHLRRAVELARRGRYGAPPNPMVGTVLVRGGRVVGEGWHARAGQAHAEAAALAAARADGQAVAGSTVYVSLEPCSHQGRTPPCSDALVAAGVARVVALHGDPDPRVAGDGMARLRDAGIDATLATATASDPGAWPPELAADAAALVERALALNLHFLVPAVLGRPAVTLKWAMSLDGRIATAGGDSQWISSPRGRRWSLDLRERHDAILVGSGTALADDPRLDRRLGLAPGPITRVILDRRLRLPPTARTLGLDGPVLVYTAAGADEGRGAALEAAGATVIRLSPDTAGNAAAMPAAVLADLARRGVGSLLVEGGGEVAASWLASGLYDRVHASVAPLLIGGRDAPGPLGGAGAEPLAAAPRLTDLHVRRRGPDVILTGLREQCLPELSSSVGAS